MRFLIGLLLGLGLGFAGALLFAPERHPRTRDTWDIPPQEEELPARASQNHDFTAALRRALRSLQDQVQEAWDEARQAAQDAEQEMRQRYERSVRRPAARPGRPRSHR